MSAHPVITVLLLHWVRVEDANDSAGLRLPQLPVHVVEEQQGHKHLQVVQVIQLPDAEGFALQGGCERCFRHGIVLVAHGNKVEGLTPGLLCGVYMFSLCQSKNMQIRSIGNSGSFVGMNVHSFFLSIFVSSCALFTLRNA